VNTPPTVTGYFFPVDYQMVPTTAAGIFAILLQAGSTRSYQVVVPAANRIFAIDNVSQTIADQEGGCHCPEIKEIQFTVNGQAKTLNRQAIVSRIPTILQR
jgi:hypothetical protein